MKKKMLRTMLLLLILAGIAGGLIGCTLALPTFDPSKLTVTEPTTIYDVNNQPAMVLTNGVPEYATYNEIPTQMRNAIVAIEDHRFYEHQGIDFYGMGRALFIDILHGGSQQGGSTLTQQLAKNVYVGSKKTLTRKIQELAITAQIERNYTKNEILEMYLNHIFFGENAVGIKKAAQVYFGKNLQDLTLAECALLAGLPNAPTYYDPYIHAKEATDRRNLVLEQMNKYGYITTEQMNQAKAEPLHLKKGSTQDSNYKYPFYLDYVLDDMQRLGYDPKEVLQGGFKIYTSLDPKVQDPLQRAYHNNSLFPRGMNGDNPQSAAVIINPQTGGVAGLVGGRGDSSFGDFNRATQARRSPGSSIKPLVVYGPALEAGWKPTDSLVDKNMTFPGGYSPRDWDGNARGQVTMEYAIQESWNIPAVWLLNQIGIGKGVQFAEQLGIQFTDQDKTHLGIALGAMEKGVSPLQMAQAYQAFDNKGKYIQAHAVTKVTNSANVVLENPSYDEKSVMSPNTATTMTKLLQNVVLNGTGKLAQVRNQPTAGKTGTNEYADGTKSHDTDLWFVGYTPQYVGAVWLGYDQTDAKHYLSSDSGVTAALFANVMDQALSGVQRGQFYSDAVSPPPKNVTQPTSVSDLSAVLTDDKKGVQLKWTKLDQNITYTINRMVTAVTPSAAATDKGGQWQAIGQTNSGLWTDTSIQPGSTYNYVLSYTDSNGQELRSNTVSMSIPNGNTGNNADNGGTSGNTPAGSNPNGDSSNAPGIHIGPGGATVPDGTGTGGTNSPGTPPSGANGNGSSRQPGSGAGTGTTGGATGNGGGGSGTAPNSSNQTGSGTKSHSSIP